MATPDPAVHAYLAQAARPCSRRRVRGEGEIGLAAQKQCLLFYVVRTDVMAAHRTVSPA